MHILFAGGGTAGHINPALAVAGYIKNEHNDAKISYIGTPNGMESRLVPAAGYDFYGIDVKGFQRKINAKNVVRNIKAAYLAVTATLKAKKLLQKLNPDVVMGTGGYVSGPVLKAAAQLGIKTCIHEQNAYPGVTTKMLVGKVDAVMLAMPEAKKHLELKKEPYITGNPVRVELIDKDKAEARAKLGLDSRPMILSFGGSLGARPINEAVADLMKAHVGSLRYYHFHGTGKSGYEAFNNLLTEKGVDKENNMLHIIEYIDNMDVLLPAADLVICRAGAISLSELEVCGKPSILIPSPYVAENHQYHNAMTLKEHSAAEVIEEKNLTGETLTTEVMRLLSDKQLIDTMAINAKAMAINDANKRIYDVVMSLYSKS